MKIAFTIARYLLGLLFTVFGLNGFLHFLNPPPPSSALAIQWMTVMVTSHYMLVAFAFQFVAGLLLLSGRYVPLAVAILAPILVNILTFHITMDPAGIGLALFASILWAMVFTSVRASFRGLFQPSSELRQHEMPPREMSAVHGR